MTTPFSLISTLLEYLVLCLSFLQPECPVYSGRNICIPHAEQQPVLSFNEEEQAVVNSVGTNIKTYVDESVSKFMLGERSFDEWDAYVAEVEALGLDQLKAVHESSYARVLAAQEG